MEQLQGAVRQVIDDLTQILEHLDGSAEQLKERHRTVIELELGTLHRLDKELSNGPPTRRSWSLGQASIPILSSMLNAVRRAPVTVPASLLDRTRRSVFDLADALNHTAEGRD